MMAMDKLKVNPAKVDGRRPLYHAVKRLFDVVASACGLILLSPLFLFLIIFIGDKNNDAIKGFPSQLAKLITM